MKFFFMFCVPLGEFDLNFRNCLVLALDWDGCKIDVPGKSIQCCIRIFLFSFVVDQLN
jgi:hypothetical protein